VEHGVVIASPGKESEDGSVTLHRGDHFCSVEFCRGERRRAACATRRVGDGQAGYTQRTRFLGSMYNIFGCLQRI
jgi:hypothetical protein